jgi:hypothetical protein
LRLVIFFFLLSMVATASAVSDPLATNFTGGIDELELLLAVDVTGSVNRSAGYGLFNQTRHPDRADPPFYHLMKNDTMFRDFENLTAPVEMISFAANDSQNESFFEALVRDWW